MGLLSSLVLQERSQQFQQEQAERNKVIAHAMELISRGDAVSFKAFEDSFKKHGIELDDRQKALMITQGMLNGVLQRLGNLGDIEKMQESGERLPNPAAIVTRPGPGGETEFYTGVPQTERLRKQTEAQALGGLSEKVTEAQMKKQETVEPMKAFERKYFTQLIKDDPEGAKALVQQNLLPSLDQLTVGWILDQENSSEIIGDLVKQRTEAQPPKSRTVPVQTDKGIAWETQEWDGKTWKRSKGTAHRPINELSTREIILNLSRLQQIKKSIDMAAQYPGMAAVLGVEGMDPATIEQGIAMLEEMLREQTGQVALPETTREPDPLNLLNK